MAADSGSQMYSFVSALGSTYGAGLAVATIVIVERLGLRSVEGPWLESTHPFDVVLGGGSFIPSRGRIGYQPVTGLPLLRQYHLALRFYELSNLGEPVAEVSHGNSGTHGDTILYHLVRTVNSADRPILDALGLVRSSFPAAPFEIHGNQFGMGIVGKGPNCGQLFFHDIRSTTSTIET